jgi:hypothetical protein
MKQVFEYKVHRLKVPMKLDAKWSKKVWRNVAEAEIMNHMGSLPRFFPVVRVRMLYDSRNLYVIFLVKDRYVRCLTNTVNGSVWEDSCVEFFFAPDNKFPGRYFSLEVNCGGTPLMHYNIIPRKEIIDIDPSYIQRIEIAHSLPEFIDPEIKKPVSWRVEYCIPFDMLQKYSGITAPEQGREWRANFYKTAGNSSNPHYLTWTVVANPVPDFHLPQFFGNLKFT